MKLYQIMFDGEARFVEAESFAAAIEVWKQVKAIEWGEDYDGTEEPESVSLMSDEPVLRRLI